VFRKTPGGDQIALYVPMGDVLAVLPVHQIHLEFDIPADSEDHNLMGLAGQALQYLPQVYPGDSIPREVLTGKAPWMVDPKFLEMAKAWVTMLVVSWKTGEDISALKRKDMMERAAKPETQQALEAADAEIAAAVAPEDPKPEHVRELLEKLAQELSYIEALREKFLDIRRMQTKLKGTYTSYQGEKAVAEQITRCNSLFEKPIKEFFEKFVEFDTYVVDLTSILKRFDAQVNFIRGERDAFRQIYLLWQPLLDRWEKFGGGRGEEGEALIRETYRFAAQHYVQTVDW
ncbi:MAG: hypothetical protein RL477_2243, partial [Pseudomonadota bacterium]